MKAGCVLWLLALAVCLPRASAGIVISQVLYDPVGTESGGEAVELHNSGSAAVNISSWVIATGASDADATIPDCTILWPGASYLVADKGWSTARDNPDWQPADHEETITLANSDSGVALRDSGGSVVDAVGWGNRAGIRDGLFEGSPARQAGQGMALLRISNTGSNADDFVAAEPMFLAGNAVLILLNVTNTTLAEAALVNASVEDDLPEAGIQLMPAQGRLRSFWVNIMHNGSDVRIFWQNMTIIPLRNGSHWNGLLGLEYWQPPGQYAITISAGSQNITVPVSILELKAAKAETRSVALQALQGGSGRGKIRVWNQGNVPVMVSWSGNDLVFGTARIAASALEIEAATIRPAEHRDISILLHVPVNAIPGDYRAVVVMET